MSAADPADASVDTDSPWLGLASFTEATRGYFYGREQEITELERRVQRKLLTVLFGKSGLGKTSILQAGLVPGLRARGYFPVYLRIDYGHDSPEASEQIKQAINRAAVGRTGEREDSRAGAAAGEEAAARGAAAPAIDPSESIWEFLHHREVLQDSNVVPRDIGVVPQDSGTAPGDVSAETRTVKSAASPPAPTAPLGATAQPIATRPPRPAAPHRPSAPPTPIPLLIFDQFEELFTLAQSDEFGRARAARFVEELADLVENRPPQALEAKLDSDDSLAERFDFSRSDYRVVISLREDYLAPLESLKREMPSLSQNRLRLAPMTGAQALEAVLLPGQRLAEDSVLPGQRPGAGAAQVSGGQLEAGGQLSAGAAGPPGAGAPLEPEAAQVPGGRPGAGRALVSEEVAEAIVRFVAGGAELANAEVEPSLLSLICRELNEQRLAQHHSEISLGLLAGSRESILGSFYERALADQPPAVRSLIEDELLTESGYRENLAEESLLRKLQTAGAAPDALAKLVNRRLLRIEERLDVRRVELTHDVLTGVVKASRDQRHEREARAATERLLAEQAARESAARRALRRARAIAAGCTALAVAAVIAALFAVVNVRRARLAEADARQTRIISEQARQQAEGLLGFLTDDFVRELETFGRYQTIADLSQREIDYFRALPPQLKDPQSIRNGALALVNHGSAAGRLGNLGAADKNLAEAVTLLEQLRRSGDRSDATAVVLARAYAGQGTHLTLQNNAAGYADGSRAIALLRPIVERAGSPIEARRAYMEALTFLTYWGQNSTQVEPNEAAIRTGTEAMQVAIQLGVRGDHADATLEADYANTAAFLVFALTDLGRNEEARRVGKEALPIAEEVVARYPQFGAALGAEGGLEAGLGVAAANDLDPAEALDFARQSLQVGLAQVRLEPKNILYVVNSGESYNSIASSLWALGRLGESISYDRKAMDAEGAAAAGFILAGVSDTMATTVYHQAQLGDTAGALATSAAAEALVSPGKPRAAGTSGSYTEIFANALRTYPAAVLAYERGDFEAARRIAHAARTQLQASRPRGEFETSLMNAATYRLADIEGRAEYALGDYAAAAQDERTALPACQGAATFFGGDPGRTVAGIATWQSMALAHAGKRAEAARTIGPVVTLYRRLAAKNHGDQWLPLELAEALYAQSLTDDAHRAGLLREAAQRMEHLAPSIAALHDTRAWRARILQARQGSSGPLAAR